MCVNSGGVRVVFARRGVSEAKQRTGQEKREKERRKQRCKI
jgi:hypothetical protein